jgi:hypothetical protein
MPGHSDLGRRALTNAGYTRLGQLVNASAKEVRELHGMGPKAFEVLRRRLADQGLAFAASPGQTIHSENRRFLVVGCRKSIGSVDVSVSGATAASPRQEG